MTLPQHETHHAFGTQVPTPGAPAPKAAEPLGPAGTPPGAPAGQPLKQGRTPLHAPTPVVAHQPPRSDRAAPPRGATPPGPGGGFNPQPPRGNDKVTPAVPLHAAKGPAPIQGGNTKATMMGLGQGAPPASAQPVTPAALDDEDDNGMTVEEFFAKPRRVHHDDDLPAPKRSAVDEILAMNVGAPLGPSLAPPAIPVAPAAHEEPQHAAPPPPPQAAAFNPQHGHQGQQPWSLGDQHHGGRHGTFPPGQTPAGWGDEKIKPPLNPTPWWVWGLLAIFVVTIIVCLIGLVAIPAIRHGMARWDNWHPFPTVPSNPMPQQPPVVQQPPPAPPITPGQLVDPLDHCTRANTVGGTVDNNAVLMCCRLRVADIQATSTTAHGVWLRVEGQDAPSQMGTSGYAQVCIPGNRPRVRWRE